MSFGEAIKSVFSKYATFSGRARRSEFWYFFLFNVLVSLVLSIIPFLSILSFIWALGVLVPTLAVTVRRFHDIGKSGWYYLLFLIPSLLYLGYIIYFAVSVVVPLTQSGFDASNMQAVMDLLMANKTSLLIIGILELLSVIALIVWIVWMARDSQPGVNKWGPNPKEMPNNDPEATIY